jgi:hypothetical protein
MERLLRLLKMVDTSASGLRDTRCFDGRNFRFCMYDKKRSETLHEHRCYKVVNAKRTTLVINEGAPIVQVGDTCSNAIEDGFD